MSSVQLSPSPPQHPKPHPSRTHTLGPAPPRPYYPPTVCPQAAGVLTPSPGAPRRCPSSISAPPPSLAPPSPAHSLVPGRDSTVRKMVKPKATRCAKIPLPLRSQRVSLGSLVGVGTRPTSRVCIAGQGRRTLPDARTRLPGLRTRRRPWLRKRLLPQVPPAMRQIRPQRPLGAGGESASAGQSPSGEGHLTTPGPLSLKPTSLYLYVYKGLRLM